MIFRREKYTNESFTTIPNALLRGSKEAKPSERRHDLLSAESLGVLVYLLSHDESWKVTQAQLCNVFKMSKSKVTKVCRELEGAGYAVRKLDRNAGGQLTGWDWSIYDSINQINEKPDLENPQVVKQPLRNTIGKEKQSKKKTVTKNFFDNQTPAGVPKQVWDRWWAYRISKEKGSLPSKATVALGTKRFQLLVREKFDIAAVVGLSIERNWTQVGDPSWDAVKRFYVGNKDDLLGAVK